jgi:hypothetical protein
VVFEQPCFRWLLPKEKPHDNRYFGAPSLHRLDECMPRPTVVAMMKIRKGQAPAQLERAEFSTRFRAAFFDPVYRTEDAAIARLEEIAWQIYQEGRKSPFTQKAGPGYADPDLDLSSEWVATQQRIDAAQRRWADPASPSRVLLICGSARNDGSCASEMSKTFRLLGLAREILEQAAIHPSKSGVNHA